MRARNSFILLLTLILWACSACTAAGPRQIAAAPRLTPIAEYPENSTIIYQAYIELQVADVDAAGRWAADLAQRHGGYVIDTKSWVVDGRTASTLNIAVPTYNLDRLRAALIQLGTLVNETINSRPVEPPSNLEPYSTITLHLRPADMRWSPPVPEGRWNPGRTFQSAFDVFLAIFGFIADLLIWVLVVAGPFALIFLIAWWAGRRLRQKS